MKRIAQQITYLIGNTPLVELRRFAPDSNIIAKLEISFRNFTSGLKRLSESVAVMYKQLNQTIKLLLHYRHIPHNTLVEDHRIVLSHFEVLMPQYLGDILYADVVGKQHSRSCRKSSYVTRKPFLYTTHVGNLLEVAIKTLICRKG